MRQNENYLLKHVAQSAVLVPVGQAAVDFPGMISLNGTGELLWELLAVEQSEESLRQALQERFDAPPQKIAADVETFLRRLRLAGALIE